MACDTIAHFAANARTNIGARSDTCGNMHTARNYLQFNFRLVSTLLLLLFDEIVCLSLLSDDDNHRTRMTRNIGYYAFE